MALMGDINDSTWKGNKMSKQRGEEKGICLSWEQPENLAVDDRNSWEAGITDREVSWSSEIARIRRI